MLSAIKRVRLVAAALYDTWLVDLALLIASVCGLLVAAIRGVVRWRRRRA